MKDEMEAINGNRRDLIGRNVPEFVYCKTQFTSPQHNNNINYNSMSINTQLICYMFRLFLNHHQAYTSRTTVFFSVLSYSF